MWRFVLLLVLFTAMAVYYKECVKVKTDANESVVNTDSIEVDSVMYNHDDLVQIQWSVDSGYEKIN